VNAYLIVAADFLENGGMDRANLELARLVLKNGHPLHIVAHRVSAQLARVRGVHVHRVARPPRLGLLAERGLDFVGHLVAARLPRETRIVVNGGNCVLPAVNWVHFVHSADAASDRTLRSRVRRVLARWSERRAIGRARLIIANSERTRTELLQSFTLPSASVRTVYCGVDSERFFPVDSAQRTLLEVSLGFRPNLRRVVFVGALADHRKGFDVLFDAWRNIAPRWQGVELVVVGAGRLLPGWIRAAEKASLSDRLRFLGYREDVAEILKSSDLLVAPSRYEPYGLNIAEALSSGIPVIASRKSGACEALTGQLQDLLLADPQSVFELLAKLELWRAGLEKYRQAAIAASRSFRAHSWEAMSRQIYSLTENAYS
jgi:glycosyltransferase involved in cell wall biosynthesis